MTLWNWNLIYLKKSNNGSCFSRTRLLFTFSRDTHAFNFTDCSKHALDWIGFTIGYGVSTALRINLGVLTSGFLLAQIGNIEWSRFDITKSIYYYVTHPHVDQKRLTWGSPCGNKDIGLAWSQISYRGRPALVTQTKSETETEVPGTHGSQVQPVPSRLPVADSIYLEYQVW